MSRLTKKERKYFYEELLEMVCKDPSVKQGYCYYVSKLACKLEGKYKELSEGYNLFFIPVYLPELYAVKPPHKITLDFWFPCNRKGWQERITLLEEVISKM